MAGTVNITVEGNYTVVDITVATPKYSIQQKSIPNGEVKITSDEDNNQLLINADGVNYVFEDAQVLIPTGGNVTAKMDSLLASLDARGTGGALPVDVNANELGTDAWGRNKVILDYSLFSGMFTFNVPRCKWKEVINGVETLSADPLN